MTNKTAYWNFGQDAMGGYIQCSACRRKVAAKKVLFGDWELDTCPSCDAVMDWSRIDYEQLSQEASNECRQ